MRKLLLVLVSTRFDLLLHGPNVHGIFDYIVVIWCITLRHLGQERSAVLGVRPELGEDSFY
jgi:hypothetical protein